MLRQHAGDDEALGLIQEALAIDGRWGELYLDWAIIESERGNLESAEEIIAALLLRQSDLAGQIRLPIGLAVELARFRGKTDHERAIQYLRTAEAGLFPGMVDFAQYFLTLANECEAAGPWGESIATLKRGLDTIAGPPRLIKDMERVLICSLMRHDSDDFEEWVHKRSCGCSRDASGNFRD